MVFMGVLLTVLWQFLCDGFNICPLASFLAGKC